MQTALVHSSITSASQLELPRADRSYSVRSSFSRMRATMRCPMLSLKFVLSGEEIYHFHDRIQRIRAGEFLLVPEQAEYEVQIQTRFSTEGRCFYFSADQAHGLNRLADVLGARLHHIKFGAAELGCDQTDPLIRLSTAAVAEVMNGWSANRLDQLARVDRVDPLSKSRVLSGLQRAYRLIHEHYAEPWTVTQLAEAAHLSRASFTRSFTRLYGISPKRLLEQVRLAVAAEQIAKRSSSITTISVDCGYADLPTFSRAFRRCYGVPPSNWAKQVRNAA